MSPLCHSGVVCGLFEESTIVPMMLGNFKSALFGEQPAKRPQLLTDMSIDTTHAAVRVGQTLAELFESCFMKKFVLTLGVGIMCASQSFGAALTPGNLVVVQVGDGAGSLGSAATASFLKEFTLGGSLVQTINMPTVASGLNQALTLSGTATSEGFLTLSANGQFLTLGGYGAVPGTANVTTANPTTVNRVVGRVDMNGNVDTSTALTDAYNGSNIRSTASTDGVDIWTAGNAGSGQGATGGPRYTTFGSTTSVRVDSTASNMRVVNIYKGQLYVSSSSGTLLGVSTVASGLPTTLSAGPITPLTGFPTTGSHSSYDFWFKDDNTLYVADDGSAANGGGIQKWIQSAGSWSLAYTLLNTGSATTAVRGLAGTIDGNGDAVLFGTTTAGSANTLIALTDTGATSVASVLATAGANTVFRGVEFLAIVPEPSSAALLLVGGLALFFRRKN